MNDTAAPVIAPNSVEFEDTQAVTITCETAGATIYYTKNGSDPTTSSTEYTVVFTVSDTTTIKAIAVKDGNNSDIVSATFTKESGGESDPDDPVDPVDPVGPGGSGGSGGSGSGLSHSPVYYHGTIKKVVWLGENVPETEIYTPLQDLIDNILTPSEQTEIYNNHDVKMILTVDNAAKTVSAEDKLKIKYAPNRLSGYKVGMYLDISLLKRIGARQQNITQTSEPVAIEFTIPEYLYGEHCEYAAIRIHNGSATILRDLDRRKNTLTIESDKFSTCAIIYKDPNSEVDDTSIDTGEGTSSGTGSGTTSTSGETSGGTSSNTSSSTSDDSDKNPPTGTRTMATGILAVAGALTAGFAHISKRKK